MVNVEGEGVCALEGEFVCALEGEGGASEGWWGIADSFLCFLGRIEHRAATRAERTSYAGVLLEGFAFRHVCF